MISRSILSNYLWSLSSIAVSKGLRFAGIVLCIRLVGNYSWGEVVSTIALYSFLTFAIDQGLGNSPLLFHLQSRALDNRLLFLISLYRTAMAILLILGLFFVDAAIMPLGELTLVYSFVLIPRAMAMDWWFHRREYYQVTMIIGAFRTLVFFSLVAAFVYQGSSAKVVILVEMAAETAAVALGYGLMRLAKSETGGEAPAVGIRELLGFSFPFLLIGVLVNVQGSLDILLIRYFHGNETVAQYDMGIKIGFLYFFLGATIIQIIRPKLTRLKAGGQIGSMGDVLQATSGTLLLLGTFFLLPSFYFAPELVGLLYRQGSDLAVFVFRWTALWVCVTFMTMLCSDTLLALGRRRDYTKAALVCATVNFAANVILLNGVGGQGAIFAKVISEAAFLLYSLAHLPEEVRRRLSRPLLIQFLSVGALVGIYAGSALAGQRMLGFWISLGAWVAVAFFGRDFFRRTLKVLREN